MASNSFGQILKITTWGESHGHSMGVAIDGCPAGLPLSEKDIQQELLRRSPGTSPYTSPRKEQDQAQIVSGLFEGKTTGAPIAILIPNQDADSSKYESLKDLLRPGHANYPYLQKYGIFDHRGGGRASARETVCRVAAGAVAKKILFHHKIDLVAYIAQIGDVVTTLSISDDFPSWKERILNSPLFCPDEEAAQKMSEQIELVKQEGDSLGGIVALTTTRLPVGLGDPVYEKIEANLAKAMLSLPASKGIEFGAGFAAARMRGSEHNDLFVQDPLTNQPITQTNHAGGILGGITNGMPLFCRVVFKPPSSIAQPQSTLTVQGSPTTLSLPAGSRHDPCVAIRAVPVVEAMAALVLADALLVRSTSSLGDPLC